MCICKEEDPTQNYIKEVPKKNKITGTTSQKATKNTMWRQLEVPGRSEALSQPANKARGSLNKLPLSQSDSNGTNNACTLLHSTSWYQKN